MAIHKEPLETRRIRKFHAFGKDVLEADQTSTPLTGGKRRRGVAQRFMKKRGVGRDQIDKARRFAALYSHHELNELCTLTSADGKKRLTKSHLIRLLAVQKRRSRAKLAKQILKNNWSVQRLAQEITKSGKTSQGGRPPNRPATVDEALAQIERMAQQWINWVTMMESSDSDSEIGINNLPDEVARVVTKMDKAANTFAASKTKH